MVSVALCIISVLAGLIFGALLGALYGYECAVADNKLYNDYRLDMEV